MGIWFPASGYKEQLNGEYVDRVGWAGDPDFAEATLEIDWVRIEPFNESNDRWAPETWPNGWYAMPHEYPGFTAPSSDDDEDKDRIAADVVLMDWPSDGLDD